MAEEGEVVRPQLVFLLLALRRRRLLRLLLLLRHCCRSSCSRNSGCGDGCVGRLLAVERLGLEVKEDEQANVAKTGEEGEDNVGQRVHGGLLQELG